jgi:flagellar assembly factor FliW
MSMTRPYSAPASASPERKLGGMTYHDEDVISFERGLPGFEELRSFIITSLPEHAPFHWMHSIDEPGLRFVLINPMTIAPDYDPRLNKSHLNDIGIQTREDILMYVIVTLDKARPHTSTANLLGPILINIRERRGSQIILDDSRYGVNTPLFGGNV